MEDNAKVKSTTKPKGRLTGQTSSHSKENTSKQGTTHKTDSSHPPPSFTVISSIGKVLSEADKIIKLGLEKEFALLEKDSILQSLNETIENLRKNILQLQMENEKLDQNYQREISYRSDIAKQFEETRALFDSVVHYSNTLRSSFKQLEDDKLRIIDYYNLIHENQKKVEKQHKEMEKMLKERDKILQATIDDIKTKREKAFTKNEEEMNGLNHKLRDSLEKLKITSDENQKLQAEASEFKKIIHDLELSVDEQQRLHNFQEGNINTFKFILKDVKKQRAKYKRMWNRKNKELLVFKCRNKNLTKNLNRVKNLYNTSLINSKTLESENETLRTKLDQNLEDGENKYENWKAEREELIREISGKEEENKVIKNDRNNLKDKVAELKKREEVKKEEFEKLQKDSVKVTEENENLIGKVKELNQENNEKEEMIIKLQKKLEEMSDDSHVLETKLSEMEATLYSEKTQKEKAIADRNNNLQETKETKVKVNELEKILQDKTNKINELQKEVDDKNQNLDFLNEELKKAKILKSEDQIVLNEFKNEFLKQKSSNEVLNTTLESLKQKIEMLNKELEQTKTQKSLVENNLRMTEAEAVNLRKETDQQKNLLNQLQNRRVKTEEELNQMKKILEENSALKNSVESLKTRLDEAHAKMEQNKKEQEIVEMKKTKETPTSELIEPPDEKENELEVINLGKLNQRPETPLQSSRKIMTTSRSIMVSTPNSRFRSLTRAKKKSDPYEYDSDLDNLDSNQILKGFSSRKDYSKKAKTTE